EYPFSPSHRQILDVVLAQPEAVADVYADRLHMSRATYFYRLRELLPAIAQALNLWQAAPAPPASPLGAPAPAPGGRQQDAGALPVPLTSLIGAEAWLDALAALILRPDVRLLTLLGPGGIGKTRLAVEVARRAAPAFADGLCFVDLLALREAALVPAAIGQALGLAAGDGGESPALLVKAALRERRLLLILDTFEHLTDAAPLAAELLGAAPELKILVTSRAALRIYGEHEWAVPPLDSPAEADFGDLERLRGIPAVQLFAQRAQAVNPGFALTAANAPAVADLCLRMEGLPQAIELLAAQMKFFSPQALLVRLGQSGGLALLSQGPRALSPRHQTFRDMLDWSHGLLAPELQALFRRLAVFAGGHTIDAAAAVCGNPELAEPDSPAPDIQSGLTALADQSLLRQHIALDGEPRFQMLALVRAYAREQLDGGGETGVLRRAHAGYYLEWVERLMGERAGPGALLPGDVVQREYANLRAAIEWALERRESMVGLRFVVVLWDFWTYYGHHDEGWQIAHAIIEQTADQRSPVRARLFRLIGWLAHDMRDYLTMQRAFQSSLELTAELGDHAGTGLALHGLGDLARLRGRWDEARRHYEASAELFERLGDDDQRAWAIDHLGRLDFCRGLLDEARERFADSLSRFRRLGSGWGTLFGLGQLGQTLYCQGELERAEPLLLECLELGGALGATRGPIAALALSLLGGLALRRGDALAAGERLAACLALSEEIGYRWCAELAHFELAWQALAADDPAAAGRLRACAQLQQSLLEPWRVLLILEAVARFLAARRESLAASRLCGAAECLRASLDVRRPPLYQPEFDATVALLRAAVAPEQLAAAWAAGCELPLDQALLYAQRCLA
ncbi:MAG TPA: tetratricopeptide repeat protein, partial [Herpetosiphonaceae bacterium]